MQVHLQYALDLGYIDKDRHGVLADKFEHAGRMLYRLVGALDGAKLAT